MKNENNNNLISSLFYCFIHKNLVDFPDVDPLIRNPNTLLDRSTIITFLIGNNKI